MADKPISVFGVVVCFWRSLASRNLVPATTVVTFCWRLRRKLAFSFVLLFLIATLQIGNDKRSSPYLSSIS